MEQAEPKRTRFWVWVPVMIIVLITGWGIHAATAPKQPELGGTIIEKPTNMQDITLVGADGVTFSLSNLEGKFVLVFLGYANCPDVCPLTMATLARIYEELGSPDDLQVVMITVDPERDTPEALNDYIKNFHPSFIGLTGDPEIIAGTAARFFAGSYVGKGGLVGHSSHVTLLDRQGDLRAVYTQDSINNFLKDDLETLLAYKGTW